MTESTKFKAEGGCACGKVRYRLEAAPMFVHCCHCTWCQRESGSAFALNALIEMDNVTLQGEEAPFLVETPSASGRGQKIHRCANCQVALWSHYSHPHVAFIRVGTLDDKSTITPDVHIYTTTKLDWVTLPEGARSFDGFYNPKEEWPPECQARWKALPQE
ncbi:MAG: aldehyde-activating protein [Hirschia sp.]|nr:aldehyde-activating protein [Hirschia sp.]MBF19649.1 aldehyde-activating protein [Hirschia sp.]